MMKELRTSFLYTLIAGAVLTVATWFIDRTIAAGLLLGLVFGAIHQLAQVSFFQSVLSARVFNVKFFMIYFLGNFGVYAIPLYIGSVYPDFVNVFGAAFGLLLYKIMIYAEEFIKRRKER